jgi:hypothetical protein
MTVMGEVSSISQVNLTRPAGLVSWKEGARKNVKNTASQRTKETARNIDTHVPQLNIVIDGTASQGIQINQSRADDLVRRILVFVVAFQLEVFAMQLVRIHRFIGEGHIGIPKE